MPSLQIIRVNDGLCIHNSVHAYVCYYIVTPLGGEILSSDHDYYPMFAVDYIDLTKLGHSMS
jgi:hypothetical protein